MIENDPEFIRVLASKEQRMNNRKMDEFREVKVEKGIISSAEGSARVQIGCTEVIAGVKLDVGTPFPDSKDQGVLMVNSEFLTLASSKFERGPPSDASIELARVVDRAIRESKCIDVKKLCIKEGEKVWMVNVDIDILDHDGNLIDAASLAAIQALLDANFLELEKIGDDYEVHYTKQTKEKLPVSCKPVSTTFVKIGNQIMADPSVDEEDAMDARITVGTFEDKEGIKYCSMQKGGDKGFTSEELDKILIMAEEHGKNLRKLIK